MNEKKKTEAKDTVETEQTELGSGLARMRERDKYKGRVEENSSMFSSQGDWEEGGAIL